MAQTPTRKLSKPLRSPTRNRALYDGKDVDDPNLRYQGSVGFGGAKALESARKSLSAMTGRAHDRISDADVFEFLARCWRDGQDAAVADLRTRGHVA